MKKSLVKQIEQSRQLQQKNKCLQTQKSRKIVLQILSNYDILKTKDKLGTYLFYLYKKTNKTVLL